MRTAVLALSAVAFALTSATCFLSGSGTEDGAGGGFASTSTGGMKSASSSSAASVASSSTGATGSCTDGIKNDYESDVDCGGFTCPHCGYGRACNGNDDCQSGRCSAEFKVCETTPYPVWRQASPASLPVGHRNQPAMFEDPTGDVALYGGANNLAIYSDTWRYDGGDWADVDGAAGPGQRYAAAVAYDSDRKVVVMTTGTDFANNFNDTWEWDGASWKQIVTTQSPPFVSNAAMAYDPSRKVMVFFGGQYTVNTYSGQTWEYSAATGDAATASWQMIADSATGNPAQQPAPRTQHALVYDPQGKSVLLYGGIGATEYADTWRWDGMSWTALKPTKIPVPATRWAMQATTDTDRGVAILFGGYSGTTALSDTYEWDEKNGWQVIDPVYRTPPEVDFGGFTYASGLRRSVLFGGTNSGDGGVNDETWEYFVVGGGCAKDSDCGSGVCLAHLCCATKCTACERCDTEKSPGICADVCSDAGSDADASDAGDASTD